ncbi:MAG TPA: helix-turn-helix transcriptional regulator, partial [Castellaniella sp.]|nr:helix-turn-helix transcriptional regulator [Castellaniella sp.]
MPIGQLRSAREARIFAGLTQAELGELVGVSYQQIYRYETSINRIPAGRLWQIAAVLAVPVERLFPHADEKAAAIAPVVHHAAAQQIVSFLRHEMSSERVRAL